jgi:hypothetical protein
MWQQRCISRNGNSVRGSGINLSKHVLPSAKEHLRVRMMKSATPSKSLDNLETKMKNLIVKGQAQETGELWEC